MGQVFTTTGIEVQNSVGSTVVDTSGVNSFLNFAGTALTYGGTQSIINTEADITSTTGTIVVSRQTQFLFLINVDSTLVYSTTNGANTVYFNLNGTNQTPFGRMGATHAQAHNTTLEASIAFYNIQTLAAGTHTVKLRLANNNASGATVEAAQLVYLSLGI